MRLYPHRKSVVEANDICVRLLPGESHSYHSKDAGKSEVLNRCPAPNNLILKVNARVVLLKNLNERLVNGIRGTIIGFTEYFPCLKFDNGDVQLIREEVFVIESQDGIVNATRKQIPLDLAYALTIHKSQGMAFDHVEIS